MFFSLCHYLTLYYIDSNKVRIIGSSSYTYAIIMTMKPGGKKLKKIKIRQNLPLIITGLVALGLVSTAAYVYFNRPENRLATETKKPTDHPGAGAAEITNNPGSGGVAEGNEGGSYTSPSANQTDPQYNSTTLASPIQTFNKSRTPVSLSQTDTSQPDHPTLVSTCQSVAGATCEIHAILGSADIVVAGPMTVSDDTTGAEMSWNAKDKGLTKGVWTIKAVAKKGGQTSTSTSNYTLTVNP